jgi:hypothetical protein
MAYYKLKEEELDSKIWRTRFGRGYATVARQTTEWTCTEQTSIEQTYAAFEFELFISRQLIVCGVYIGTSDKQLSGSLKPDG